ncbi:MAG: hypothetical protein JKX67_12290 [Colwellia sp.]|nr:hypothetical protein [Colwellia sp.]
MIKGKKQHTNESPVINADTVGRWLNNCNIINHNKSIAVILKGSAGSGFFSKVCRWLLPYKKQHANQAGMKLKNITNSQLDVNSNYYYLR